MIRIDFDPACLTSQDGEWLSAPSSRAKKATNKLIESFENWVVGPDQNDQTQLEPGKWTELRTWFLMKCFYNKCAYCECDISRFYGDAEHYRQKGSVKFKAPNQGFTIATWEIPVDPPETQWVHPGYF